MLLLLLLMPAVLLVMLRALEKYEQFLDRPTKAAPPPASGLAEQAVPAEAEQERAPERAPGFATEVA